MTATTVQQMADRVAELMEQRLKVKGSGLAEKLQRGGRKLPRKVRQAAQELANAAAFPQNPKLAQQLDLKALGLAYDTCLRHLDGIGKWDRRRAGAENIALSVVTSMLVLAAIIAAILHWRGYV